MIEYKGFVALRALLYENHPFFAQKPIFGENLWFLKFFYRSK